MVRALQSSIIIAGDKNSVVRAKLLMEVHLSHQSRLWKGPSREATSVNRSSSISFKIPEDIVGLVIGKGGSNIASVSKKHNVDVRVSTKPDAPSIDRTVTIVGQSDTSVRAAKDDLFGDKFMFKIDNPKIVGLVLGKRKTNLIDISKKAGLYRAQFHEDGNEVELIGTKDAIETAQLLLESHIEYFKTIQSDVNADRRISERYNKSHGA
jgi:predicted PilT family ATPase